MKVLMAKIEPFELESIREDIDGVVKIFDEYLDTYRPRAKGTAMYALLGPVTHIIQKCSVTQDVEELTGYGIRIHENKAYLSPEAKEKLYIAIKGFIDLIEKEENGRKVIPRVMRPRIIERIRYKLYFRRKSALMKYLQEREKQFREYLQSKFENINALNKETEEEFSKFDEIRYPTATVLEKYGEKMKEICGEFLKGEYIDDQGGE